MESYSAPQSTSARLGLVTNGANFTKSHNIKTACQLPVHPVPSPLPFPPSNHSSREPGGPASEQAPRKRVQRHPTCSPWGVLVAVVRMAGRSSPGIPPAGDGFGLGQQRTRRFQDGSLSSSSRQTRVLHQCPLGVPVVMTRRALLASWKKRDGRGAWTCGGAPRVYLWVWKTTTSHSRGCLSPC